MFKMLSKNKSILKKIKILLKMKIYNKEILNYNYKNIKCSRKVIINPINNH